MEVKSVYCAIIKILYYDDITKPYATVVCKNIVRYFGLESFVLVGKLNFTSKDVDVLLYCQIANVLWTRALTRKQNKREILSCVFIGLLVVLIGFEGVF